MRVISDMIGMDFARLFASATHIVNSYGVLVDLTNRSLLM
jgi:hypothetical protein